MDNYVSFYEERVAYCIEKFEMSRIMLLHIVSVSAFANRNVVDLSGIFNRINSRIIGTNNDYLRINTFGVYFESNDRSGRFQLFRNRIIEHATIRIIEG